MSDIYYNTPCELYRGFLESDKKMQECLENILNFAIVKAYEKHKASGKNLTEIASKYCGVNVGSESCQKRVLKEGKKLIGDYETYVANTPAYFCINHDVFWLFRDKETTTEERAVLLANLALRSMIGKRDIMRTNTVFLLSRMAGNTKAVPLAKIPDCIVRYGERYQREKLQRLLYERHGITFYAGTKWHTMRGFYFSTTLTVEELIKRVEADRQAAAVKPKDPLKEARRAALEKLKLWPDSG